MSAFKKTESVKIPFTSNQSATTTIFFLQAPFSVSSSSIHHPHQKISTRTPQKAPPTVTIFQFSKIPLSPRFSTISQMGVGGCRLSSALTTLVDSGDAKLFPFSVSKFSHNKDMKRLHCRARWILHFHWKLDPSSCAWSPLSPLFGFIFPFMATNPVIPLLCILL